MRNNDIGEIMNNLHETPLETGEGEALPYASAGPSAGDMPLDRRIAALPLPTYPQASAPAVAAGEPFMYAIMEPNGSAHMDEFCVAGNAEDLYSTLNGLNDSPDTGYSIVPVYLAAPQQQAPARDLRIEAAIMGGALEGNEVQQHAQAALSDERESQTIAQLRKSLAGWQEECNVLRDDRDSLRQRLDLQALHQKNDVWYWQGDGTDYPESISNSMAVVIRGDRLRAILAAMVAQQGETAPGAA